MVVLPSNVEHDEFFEGKDFHVVVVKDIEAEVAEVSVVVDGIVENDGLDIVLEGFERGFVDNAIGGY